MNRNDDAQSTSAQDDAGQDDAGQVSEASSLQDGPEEISPEDSVAGAPAGESGKTDEGPTGPDAVTNASRHDKHGSKDDVETTG